MIFGTTSPSRLITTGGRVQYSHQHQVLVITRGRNLQIPSRDEAVRTHKGTGTVVGDCSSGYGCEHLVNLLPIRKFEEG